MRLPPLGPDLWRSRQDAARCLSAAAELEPGLRSDARLMAALQRSSTAAREAEELGSGAAQQLPLFAERR